MNSWQVFVVRVGGESGIDIYCDVSETSGHWVDVNMKYQSVAKLITSLKCVRLIKAE